VKEILETTNEEEQINRKSPVKKDRLPRSLKRPELSDTDLDISYYN
jgi:hypothetical protein